MTLADVKEQLKQLRDKNQEAVSCRTAPDPGFASGTAHTASQILDLLDQLDLDPLTPVVRNIYDTYARVASGQTRGAGGTFYADGKGTLSSVDVPVETLEQLAVALGQKVYGRTHQDRYQS